MNIPTGELVFSSTLVLVGGTCSGFIVGKITDNYGCRGIRVIFQSLQIVLLLFLLFINSDTPYLSYVIGVIFFLFGFLMWGSASIGYIFMLNYQALHLYHPSSIIKIEICIRLLLGDKMLKFC